MSFIEAHHLEKKYDKNRLHGHVYCAFELINLFKRISIENDKSV